MKKVTINNGDFFVVKYYLLCATIKAYLHIAVLKTTFGAMACKLQSLPRSKAYLYLIRTLKQVTNF
jgi:hypothetical protein